MLAVLDHHREPANLNTGRFRNQAGREPFQIRQQHGDLPLIEDGVEVGVGFCVFPSKSTQASSTPRRPQQARRIAWAI